MPAIPVILWAVGLVTAGAAVTGGYSFGREVGEGINKTMPIAGLAVLVWVIIKANEAK